MAKSRDERTPEEWRQATEDARRSARYKFAADRIQRIVDGVPSFTDEQLSELAGRLLSARASDAPQ